MYVPDHRSAFLSESSGNVLLLSIAGYNVEVKEISDQFLVDKSNLMGTLKIVNKMNKNINLKESGLNLNFFLT